MTSDLTPFGLERTQTRSDGTQSPGITSESLLLNSVTDNGIKK